MQISMNGRWWAALEQSSIEIGAEVATDERGWDRGAEVDLPINGLRCGNQSGLP